jgi:hypothetical protein
MCESNSRKRGEVAERWHRFNSEEITSIGMSSFNVTQLMTAAATPTAWSAIHLWIVVGAAPLRARAAAASIRVKKKLTIMAG